ncbi:hypothetical protein MRB53_026735 [Persea americana]|uniref:Uncharacterized protein n=1 Tax=Persea americana TaxID=3435 RepID=A0ACC2LJ19_PERAE|nr:hypothetical protein MRB53_026735 [Persea americana]
MAATDCNGTSKKQFTLLEIKFTKLFINGQFVDAISNALNSSFLRFFLDERTPYLPQLSAGFDNKKK